MAKKPHIAEPTPRRCFSCGKQFTWINLAVNLALAVLKFVIGLIATSRALIAGALYSINDVLSGVIVIISLRVAQRPPDQQHPYGYGKAEFIAIGIVSTVLAGAVIFILIFSVVDIIRGVDAPPHAIALLVAAATMATNEFLARRGFCVAHHLGSPVLRTSAEHNRADAISSLATIVGVSGALMGLHLLDPIVAIFETVHIVWLSGSLLGNSLSGLMDAGLPANEVNRIRSACSGVPGVLRVVTLRSRQAGPKSWVDAEVALPLGLTIKEAHQITEEVRRAIRRALGRAVEAQVKFRTDTLQATAQKPSASVESHA